MSSNSDGTYPFYTSSISYCLKICLDGKENWIEELGQNKKSYQVSEEN